MKDAKRSETRDEGKPRGRAAVALGVLCLLALVTLPPKRSAEKRAEDATPGNGTATGSTGSDPSSNSETDAGASVTMAEMTRMPGLSPGWLGETLGRLGGSGQAEAEAVWRELGELKGRLMGMPPEEAVRALLEFLDSGADFEFGIDFVVGPGGGLSSWPTARVFALDVLGEVDRNEAGRYAEGIFESHTTADEWAVALRDYGLEKVGTGSGQQAQQGRAEVEEIAQRLLRYEEWRENPTVGYYEAYDIIPFLQSVPLVETILEQSVYEGNLEMPAHIALNKLITAAPDRIPEVYPNVSKVCYV